MHIEKATAQVVKADTIVQQNVRISGVSVEMQETSKHADSLRHRRIKRTILKSTAIPGWGQISNRQAWKVPLVAAAVTIPVVLFISNLKEYRALRDAYIIRLDNDPTNDNDIPEKYQPLSDNSIKYYRDSYRQNVDYSALVFILAWGLNVVDAAVFANLRDFDVSDKLSLKLKPTINLYGQSGVGLVLTFRDAKKSKPFFTN
ncbi:hypothetical protein BH10BAC3_BH10BAC3_42670 [soil metagenome]